MDYIHENKETKIYDSYDVIVVGAGVAGVGAALAAARQGAKTLMIEKAAYSGGLATLGHVCIYLPLCDGKGRKVVGGIAEELLHASIRYGYNDLPKGWTMGIDRLENPKGRYKTTFNIPAFVLAMDEMLQESGVHTLYDTEFSEPVMEGSRCTGIIVENKSGRCAYLAKAVVDATGDADVMFRAGAECFDRPTMLSYWCYDTDLEHMKQAIDENNVMKAVNVRVLGQLPSVKPEDFEGDLPENNDENREYYGTNGEEVSKYLQISRKLALDYLKEHQSPGYTMVSVGGMADFRTTRRIVGQYELAPEDVGKSFPDSIGCTGDWRRFGDVYEIPYRCLIDKKIQNILAAGRNIASRDDAWEVTRVIPPAVLTGEAAGTAAALAAKANITTNQIDIAGLQAVLAENGVLIHH